MRADCQCVKRNISFCMNDVLDFVNYHRWKEIYMIPSFIKDIFWKLPFMTDEKKSALYFALRDKVHAEQKGYKFSDMNHARSLDRKSVV